MTFNVTFNFYELKYSEQCTFISAIKDSKTLDELLNSVFINNQNDPILGCCIPYLKVFITNDNLSIESLNKTYDYIHTNDNIAPDDAEELMILLLNHKNSTEYIATGIYNSLVNSPYAYSDDLSCAILGLSNITKDMIVKLYSSLFDEYTSVPSEAEYPLIEKFITHPNTPLSIVVEFMKYNIPEINSIAIKALERFYD